MLENIKEKDLIITTPKIKKDILKQISKEKKLINIKLMTKEEFENKFFGIDKEKSLYYLMKNHNLKFELAQEYINNIYISAPKIRKFYNELKNEGLIKENKLFKTSFNNIKIIGYDVDDYFLEKIKNYNPEIIKEKENNYTHEVIEFQNQTDELVYIAVNILEDLKNINIKDIFIVNASKDYDTELNRIFKLFKIPVYQKTTSKIYSTVTAKTFLENLNNKKDIQAALDQTPKNDIYNQIVTILNKYTFIKEVDKTFINIIKNELKHTSIKTNKLKDAIKIITPDQMDSPNKKYYMLGFNQGIIPSVYQDDDIIKDKEKKKLKIHTSEEKNKIEKQNIIKKIKNIKNLTITYKLKDTFSSYYPSPLIKEMDMKVVTKTINSITYSNDYNKLLLGKLLDNYLNYNEIDERLLPLYETYKGADYKTYDNQYNLIDKKDLKEYLKGNLTLSYTSMNNFYLCPFSYYAKHILKLEPFEETIDTKIGNLFHNCLSQIYKKDFNLEKSYQEFINKENLTPKELFFIKKLYKNLKEDIEVIKWQDKHSNFKTKDTEKELFVIKNGDLKIKFKGFVDKISTLEYQGTKYRIITDYKTGNKEATLDNITDGLNMQLPVYAYLIKEGLKDRSKVAGLYIQNILTAPKIDEESDLKNNLKLNGYTINDENIIKEIDDTYDKSEIIRSLKKTQNGFYAYSKLITEEEIDKLINITNENINKAVENIKEANFKISPKRLDKKEISCEYCKFKDLCFKREENIVNLEKKTFKQIMEDDTNA